MSEPKTSSSPDPSRAPARETRSAMKGYGRQLDIARRLASAKARVLMSEAMLAGDFAARIRIEEGVDSVDPDPSANRRAFVKRAAEMLFLGIIYNGPTSPITEDIRKELSSLLGKDVEFVYPPGGRLRLAVREDGGLRPLEAEEQRRLMPDLRRIASQKIDVTTLGGAAHGGSGVKG